MNELTDIYHELLVFFSDYYLCDVMYLSGDTFWVEYFSPSLLELYELEYGLGFVFGIDFPLQSLLGCATLLDCEQYIRREQERCIF